MKEVLIILAKLFGDRLAKDISRRLLAGQALDTMTIDIFISKAKQRRIDMLLALERGRRALEAMNR